MQIQLQRLNQWYYVILWLRGGSKWIKWTLFSGVLWLLAQISTISSAKVVAFFSHLFISIWQRAVNRFLGNLEVGISNLSQETSYVMCDESRTDRKKFSIILFYFYVYCSTFYILYPVMPHGKQKHTAPVSYNCNIMYCICKWKSICKSMSYMRLSLRGCCRLNDVLHPWQLTSQTLVRQAQTTNSHIHTKVPWRVAN